MDPSLLVPKASPSSSLLNSLKIQKESDSSRSCGSCCPDGLELRPSMATCALTEIVSPTFHLSLLPSPLQRGSRDHHDHRLMGMTDIDPQLRLKRVDRANRTSLPLHKMMEPQKPKKDPMDSVHQCRSCCVSEACLSPALVLELWLLCPALSYALAVEGADTSPHRWPLGASQTGALPYLLCLLFLWLFLSHDRVALDPGCACFQIPLYYSVLSYSKA